LGKIWWFLEDFRWPSGGGYGVMPTHRPLRLRSFALSIFILLLLVSLPRGAAAQPAGYVFDPGNYYFSIIDTATQWNGGRTGQS
jgi:hypothetical protein